MMILDEKPHVIKLLDIEYWQEKIERFWEKKAKQDPISWSEKDDKVCRRCEKRNHTIETIRENFLSETKERKHNYEYHGNYGYKSPEHRKQFFEILEAAGLVRPGVELDTQREQNLYDFTNGFYHEVSIPKEKISAKLYMPELDPEEIERKYSLGLGGMEANL